ncbi:MAG: DNA polymerase III subunit gamma/tau [Lachnospiraceae bacterium]|nr:DNA polymerase III subunit gamma/tau [Lachnospiraceae bacterium]
MSYVALYRKARPQTFEEVSGQDHIVKTLKNQVRAGKLQHAYLFCGTRGTGKTSIAKIMSRAVNCEHPVDGNPCNECASCRAIAAGNSMNVIEIDAASNNGVDNIREIVEEVRYRPAQGNYKVYIIDEVHMLSTGAFNALLKTLEEPPSYVIFILATTESGKIPTTILSRCQRYDFRRIDMDTLMARMKYLTVQEGVDCEERALRFVARQADGSMRDALSLLDQCMAFYMGEKLTYEKALDALGAVDTDVYGELLSVVARGDAGRAIRIFEKMMERGREVGQFVGDFIWYLRNLLLAQTSDDASEMIDISSEQMQTLLALSGRTEPETAMRYIRILSELQNTMRFSTNRRVLAEVALVKLCRPQMERTEDAILDRMRVLESKFEAFEAGNFVQMQRDEPPSPTNGLTDSVARGYDSAVEDDAPPPNAAPEELRAIRSEWATVVSHVRGGVLKTILKDMVPKYDAEQMDGKLYLPIQKGPGAELGYSDAGRNKNKYDEYAAELEGVIERLYNRHVDVVIGSPGKNAANLHEISADDILKDSSKIGMPVEVDESDFED